MKFAIKNRWNASVIFEVEIECSADENEGVKLGLAVKAAIKARANLAGADLVRANLAGTNLAGANLAGANLAGADLVRANLAGAYLAGAYLARANLAGAYLARANLAGAYLAGAYLAGAYLAGADLVRANLAGTNLAGANLAGANLAGADLVRANLAGADLARAKGADITKTPLVISGLVYPVLITDTMIKIGCEQHLTTEWADFDNEQIAKMDGCSARRFWNAHKTTILALAATHQAPTKVEAEADAA